MSSRAKFMPYCFVFPAAKYGKARGDIQGIVIPWTSDVTLTHTHTSRQFTATLPTHPNCSSVRHTYLQWMYTQPPSVQTMTHLCMGSECGQLTTRARVELTLAPPAGATKLYRAIYGRNQQVDGCHSSRFDETAWWAAVACNTVKQLLCNQKIL